MSSDLGVFTTAHMSSNVAAFMTTPISPETISGMSPSLLSSPPSSLTSALDTPATPSPSTECYLPNGDPAKYYGYDLQACGGRNTTWQQCCDIGNNICTENGLCMYFGNNVGHTFSYRGGCVNANWLECPQVCLQVPVKRCATGTYCCSTDSNNDCCDRKWGQFDLSNYNPNAESSGDEGRQNGMDTSGGVGNKTNRLTIGAAVGSALGGLAMIGGAVGVWLYLRKKRVKQDKGAVPQDETIGPMKMKQVLEVGADPMVEQKCIPGSDVKAHSVVMEMDSTAVYELGV
ncbi:hypothetical protein LI328DRAFT_161627 [Trichoderma asperelloides]|nr:hypothetical protein LI328DRAFT_161627 [Trichoderma asperelloides]